MSVIGLASWFATNRAAAELWGCSPKTGDPAVRFCGSYRLYRTNGDPVPHAKCPMADVLASGHGVRDREIIVEQPDGKRHVALVNIEAIKDGSGKVIGAINVFRAKPEQHSEQVRLNGHQPASDALLQGLPTAVYTTDAAGRITFYNQAAAELWGVGPELSKSEFCGSWKLYAPDGTPMPHDECPMALALRERRPIRGMEAISERPDGTRIPFIAYPTPLFDAAGVLTGAVNTLVDISERREAEQQILESEARYRGIAAIVESSADAILTKDLKGMITSWNRGAERLFGYTPDEVIGRPISILIPEDRHHEEPIILARIGRGEPIEHFETIRRRRDGGLVEVSLTVSPVRDSEGKVIGASKSARDITERRRVEEQQRLLLREMHHRVKNLFTLASGVVALSGHRATTPKELSSAVQSRLMALARAHALTLPDISASNLSAKETTTLHALIQTILAPYEGPTTDGGARVAISGPDISVGGGSLTNLALLLHEFATNAAKYGALSTPAGHIDISCHQDNGQFHLTWTERGGPRVNHQKNGEGFGTLLARAAAKDFLEGEIARDWKPEGLTICLSIARDHVSA